MRRDDALCAASACAARVIQINAFNLKLVFSEDKYKIPKSRKSPDFGDFVFFLMFSLYGKQAARGTNSAPTVICADINVPSN